MGWEDMSRREAAKGLFRYLVIWTTVTIMAIVVINDIWQALAFGLFVAHTEWGIRTIRSLPPPEENLDFDPY